MKKRLTKTAQFLLKVNKVLLMIACVMAIAYSCANADLNAAAPKEIKVLVVDTGIGSHYALKDYVQYEQNDDYVDSIGHGTHVTGIIIYGNDYIKSRVKRDKPLFSKLCANVKIYSCKYFTGLEKGENAALNKSNACLERAIREKFDYINYSGGGASFDEKEQKLFEMFGAQGGISVVAAGNDGKSLDKDTYYPASYSRGIKPNDSIIPVQAITKRGKMYEKSNYAPGLKEEIGVDVYSTLPNNNFGGMTGTSQAAPEYLHKLLLERCGG